MKIKLTAGFVIGIALYLLIIISAARKQTQIDRENILNGFCTTEQCYNMQGEPITEEEIQEVLKPCPTPIKTVLKARN